MKKVSFGSKPAAAGNGGSADDWVHDRGNRPSRQSG